MLAGLIFLFQLQGNAVAPPGLDLEVIVAPGFVSTPCPLGSGSIAGATGVNPTGHAAHHGGKAAAPPDTIQPVKESEKPAILRELLESGEYVFELLKILDSGAERN